LPGDLIFWLQQKWFHIPNIKYTRKFSSEALATLE